MRNIPNKYSALAAYTLTVLTAFSAKPLSAETEEMVQWADIPQNAMSDDGMARIIVEVHVSGIEEKKQKSYSINRHSPEFSDMNTAISRMATADALLSSAIQSVTINVADNLPPHTRRHGRYFNYVPMFSIEVTSAGLSALQSDPRVKTVYIDEKISLPLDAPSHDEASQNLGSEQGSSDLSMPNMYDTVDLLGAEEVWNQGYTGEGWYVAVLDTGIRASHDFFADKNIVEACFSALNDCPNGESTMTGPGSAAHVSSDYFGWDHGTHVAGIAAGQMLDGSLFGIAKDAGIIAVNVFSKFYDDDCGHTDKCVMTYYSDVIDALEYVYELRTTYNIGSVNMSLGGGGYDSYCDTSPVKPIIDLLRESKIATVIAAGNDGYCGFIGHPACISTAVAVMASDKSDEHAAFSNWHPLMGDVFAPGVGIYSATGEADDKFAYWPGTSMAAPHVAGGFTLLRQFNPMASVPEILSRIAEFGPDITSRAECGAAASVPRAFFNNLYGTYDRYEFSGHTVHDTVTGLMWERSVSDDTLNHSDALNYCQNLNLEDNEDWRLPQIRELRSIMNLTLNSPAINQFLFPDTPVESLFWSSTLYADVATPNHAWTAGMEHGDTIFIEAGSINKFRCVRSSPVP